MEATLVFPLVIITLLFVANILNVCMVHVCMQQALNNTVKKISQDSYIIYRFSGEENFASFLNNLTNVNDGYAAFLSQAETTQKNFKESETKTIEVIDSFGNLSDSFNGSEGFFAKLVNFKNNIKDLIDKLFAAKTTYETTAKSIDDLAKSGKENLEAIVMKLLIDSGSGFVTTNLVEHIFNRYKTELAIPASKIQNISFLASSLNSDGSYTIVLDYEYKNPFSFVKSSSAEMKSTLINNIITMRNVITIKPFIGKNGTSFRNIDASESSSSSSSRDAGGGGAGSLTGGAGHSGGGSGGGGR